MNFKLFSYKIYINFIFYIKYSNKYLSVMIKDYIFYFKDHSCDHSLWTMISQMLKLTIKRSKIIYFKI